MKEPILLIISILLVIGIIVIVAKSDGDLRYDDFQKYEYITVEGETFKTADIIEVKGSGGYDRYYTITLKDGTKIVAEGYILRNELN